MGIIITLPRKEQRLMQENTKRAFVIKNPSSPYISEAIIFLKENMNAKEDELIQEAERIINCYLKGSQLMADLKSSSWDKDINVYEKNTLKKHKEKKKHRRHIAVLFSIATAIFALCVYAFIHRISS